MAKALTFLDRMREVALEQHGFVTAGQAAELGGSSALLAAMVRRGRLEHPARGVYRVGQVPVTEYDGHMLAVLWTGFPEACLSHDTAIDVWDISDILPDEIHVTVAAHRRIERAIPAGYVVHYEDLAPAQVTWWESIPTVTAAVAIRQCLTTGVPTYLIRQAIERSARTGLVLAGQREQLTSMLEARYA
jgi:predicted transcriptional regulator of viral defense system